MYTEKVLVYHVKPQSVVTDTGRLFFAQPHVNIKVTMNELCADLFIIIDVYRKSKYIPTVTNFVSILANCFIFAKDNSSTAFRTKFLRLILANCFYFCKR